VVTSAGRFPDCSATMKDAYQAGQSWSCTRSASSASDSPAHLMLGMGGLGVT